MKKNRPKVKFSGPLSEEPWEMQSLRAQVKEAHQGRYMAEQEAKKFTEQSKSWQIQYSKLKEESVKLL